MPARTSPEFTAAFAGSLPAAYAKKYDADVVVAHASTAARRGTAPAAVGLFGRAANGLCVVAEDRPGLLALISASLVLCRFDVNHAEVYTRDVPGQQREAVDLFWVRKLDTPPGTPLVQTDATLLEEALLGLLRGERDAQAAVDLHVREHAAPRPAQQVDATVRFVADPSGGLATLEVETTDRSGLLFSLASALFGQKVQIVESEVRTFEDRVFDRFRLVEFDGSPINSARRLDIQVAVLNAIEPARRSAPPSKG
jgi:UTP:GlnB (protein PII) uridylyltransferase